jgi:hypothetical protein
LNLYDPWLYTAPLFRGRVPTDAFGLKNSLAMQPLGCTPVIKKWFEILTGFENTILTSHLY